MKRFYFTLTFATLLSAINIAPAYGQGSELSEALIPESNYKGNGITLDEISFEGSESERLIFYNVGKKRFLNSGGLWGTRAATHTSGIAVKLIKQSSNGYYVKSPFYGEGQYMGRVALPSTDANAKTRNGVFFDRKQIETGLPVASIWTLEAVELKDIPEATKTAFNITADDHIYKIKVLNTNNSAISSDYELVANQNMTVSVFESGNTNLVEALPTTDAKYPKDNPEYTYWKIANLANINATMLEETHIYDTEPSDLTFLIRAQNFNRQNKYKHDGTEPEDDRGWFYDFETQTYGQDNSLTLKPYTTKFSETEDYGSGSITGYSQDKYGDGKYGMFYCAKIQNSSVKYGGITYKASVKSGNRIRQTVPVTKPGWYRIDCQGFYKTDGNECIARIFAYSNATDGKGTATNAYVNLLPEAYLTEYPHTISTDATNVRLTSLKAGKAPDSYLEAGIAFYTGEYPNSVLVYVASASDTKEGSITFGIETIKDFSDADAVYVDNFNLKYLGQSFALDDQDKVNSEGEFTNRPLVLRRSLTGEMWNAIVLPVNLTKYQVNTTFFPYPRIAEFKGFKDRYTLQFVSVNLDYLKENDIAMEAGKCYIIKPGYNGHTGEIQIGDEAAKTITAPYYLIDRVSYNSASKPKIQENTAPFTFPGSSCSLTIKGAYLPISIPKNAFLVYKNKLMHLTGDYKSKGYVWWIEDAHQMGANGKAHKISMSDIDSSYDETTGIINIKIGTDETGFETDDNIYNLHGQKMNDSSALPKGIYISNGKKFIVK